MDRELSPQDVVAWMREQASKFTAMADGIEETFAIHNGRKATIPLLSDRIAEVLSEGKSGRFAQIAAKVDASERDIRNAVATNADRFVANERGWVSLVNKKGDDHG